MRTFPSAFQAMLGSGVATIARTVRIELSNGSTITLTDTNQDVKTGDVVYSAYHGFTASAVQLQEGSAVSSVQLDFVMSDETFTRRNIESGIFDDAQIVVSLINFADVLPNGNLITAPVPVFVGVVSSVKFKDSNIVAFDVEGRLSQNIMLVVETYSMNCRADLGDSRCKINIEALSATGTVTAGGQTQYFHTNFTSGDNYWDNGLVVFTSGDNDGMAFEIGTYGNANGSFTLQTSAAFPIKAGDTFKAYPGCDKSTTMCQQRYSNITNFRGEPFTPPVWTWYEAPPAKIPAQTPSIIVQEEDVEITCRSFGHGSWTVTISADEAKHPMAQINACRIVYSVSVV